MLPSACRRTGSPWKTALRRQTGTHPGLFLVFLLALLGGLVRTAVQAAELPQTEAEFFETSVRPLLIGRCLKCHGESSPRGGLRLTSRASILKGGDSGPAAVAGKPGESLIVQAVGYQDEPKMPPSGKLQDREARVFDRWIAMGLPWPEARSPTLATPAGAAITAPVADDLRRFWSFQTVKAVPAPAVQDQAWVRSPVDRFILSALEAKGLGPSEPADKATLLRRATFDLTGLPPTPEDVAAFLADDSPGAFARVVDRLLASPRYGERWGRHWLDVVRYADARDLIQLPPESDFRESWRYRDWVVAAFNRDLPYTEFVRSQIAGDLLEPPRPDAINADGLVATGLLAIADFVPGDVDKDQMIADYVNDQIDVVGRAFLGLTIACARCHDHKFDPISTEDYYAMAGIFFSTRLVPAAVAGNTPLVRVPLLPKTEIAKIEAETAADRRRVLELEQRLPDAADRAYVASLKQTLVGQTARYLVAACEQRGRPSGADVLPLGDLARARGLGERELAGWIAYLDRVAAQPLVGRHPVLRDAATGMLTGEALGRSAEDLQHAVAALAERQETGTDGAPEQGTLARSCLIRFRADDPYLLTDSDGRVTVWPNRAGLPFDARPVASVGGPVRADADIGGHTRSVLRFDGQSLLEAPRKAPLTGSLFLVYRTAETGSAGQRLIGWEDSDTGRHGLGLMPEPRGALHAILRDNGRPGDLVDPAGPNGFEVVCVTWGPDGTTLHRNGTTLASKGIGSVSSDANVAAFRVGGPGSGKSPRFRGDIAEIRVYDRPLSGVERQAVEAELRGVWFEPEGSRSAARDLLTELYEELLSSRGPFWIAAAADRKAALPPAEQARLTALGRELADLKKKPPREIPRAVAVQDGGPSGTRHEGFKDAHVFLRGNPKRPGKTVPRGFPRVLSVEHPAPITEGSGRRQLADWLARSDHPLTARVMVNRIWQHHFGEGLVRSANDFGRRGERPTHPELLDALAAWFVESGWSVKAIHRLIMLSSVYQQSSRVSPRALAEDPENRLFGRMNRRRLEAEAIRDSLLAVSGRLDSASGGPAFADPAVPRRTLYLLSARTGASASDFGRLFDRADPGSIVARRGQSIVAPQALYFLNDPLVSDLAAALAGRSRNEEPGGDEARIRRLYALVLSRPPTRSEIDLGLELIASDRGAGSWERYCQVLLSLNEFIYVD